MSQEGVIDFIGTHPEIPIDFILDVGTAVAALNELNYFAQPTCGSTVFTQGSGNTITLNVTDALSNTIMGKNAGNLTLTGQFNTGFGFTNLLSLTSASQNSAFGHRSLQLNTTSPANAAFGYFSLGGLTGGNGNNTAIGSAVATALQTGAYNILIGQQCGQGLVGAESSNIQIRSDAASTGSESNTTRIGAQGTGNGQQNRCFIAGIVGVTVSNEELVTINSATGQLGVVSESGFGKTITGDTGGPLSPSAGNWNIVTSGGAGGTVSFSGSGSTLLLNTTDGTNSTAVGLAAGNASLPVKCALFGTSSGHALTTGSSATLMGYNAGRLITTGVNNTGFGLKALEGLITGANNVAIGASSGTSYAGAESSNILISNTGTIGESNTIHIGTQGSGAGQQNACYVAGIIGVTVSNQQLVTINSSTGQLGVTTAAIPTGITTWNVVGTNQTGITNNGYIFTSGAALTISLPATSAIGDMFSVVLDGATSWQITQGVGQQIRLSSSTTTSGAGGSLKSTAQGDTVSLVCRVANTTWTALSSIGNITVA